MTMRTFRLLRNSAINLGVVAFAMFIAAVLLQIGRLGGAGVFVLIAAGACWGFAAWMWNNLPLSETTKSDLQ